MYTKLLRILIAWTVLVVVSGASVAEEEEDALRQGEAEYQAPLFPEDVRSLSAPSILLDLSVCNFGVDNASSALANLGLTSVTTVFNSTDLLTQLTSGGPWDLVIVDGYAEGLGTSHCDALASYFDGGGRIILFTWNLTSVASHPLLASAGVSVLTSYTTPLPVSAWNATLLFSTPNVVPNLTTLTDNCNTDGQRLQVTTATAHAGFTASPTAGEAAITVSPSGRFLVNGFAPQLVSVDLDSDGKNDMVELYENEISLALNIGGGGGGVDGELDVLCTDFETDSGGFSLTGLWNRTDQCEAISQPSAFSLYYGNPLTCNYAEGNTAGTATSPAIDLSLVTAPISLRFDYLLQTEDAAPNFDTAGVEISTNGGSTFTLLAGSVPGQALLPGLDDPSGGWQNATLDLSAYEGAQVIVRFSFNTVDTINNAHPGFYVDNVCVSGVDAGGGGCPDVLAPGVRVQCLVNNPDGSPCIVAGSTGTVVCLSGGWWLVQWDGITCGHDGNAGCGATPAGTGWYIDPALIAILCEGGEVNDSCGTPSTIALGEALAGSTLAATAGTVGSSCAYQDDIDVWYQFTAPGDARVRFSTCAGGDFDTTLAVFDSCGGSELACNDDYCGLLSSVDLDVFSGQEYFIRVSGFAGQSGTFTLSAKVVNDECVDALLLPEGTPVSGSNVGATGGFIACAGSNDVWYSYTATQNGLATFSTCSGASFDTTLAVYDACGSTYLACNDDFCGVRSQLELNVIAGTTYLVRVAGFAGSTGTFTLTVDSPLTCDGVLEDPCPDFDTQGYLAFGTSWETLDLDGNGILDRWDLALLRTVLCGVDHPLSADAICVYESNLARFRTEVNYGGLAFFEAMLAGALSHSSELQAAMTSLLSNVGYPLFLSYDVITEGIAKTSIEPLSWNGDLDGDGLTNGQEAVSVQARGGSMAGYVAATLDTTLTGAETAGEGLDVYVDFAEASAGIQLGTPGYPFGTLPSALNATASGGTLHIKGTSTVTDTAFTGTLSTPLRIEADPVGTIRIGG